MVEMHAYDFAFLFFLLGVTTALSICWIASKLNKD